MTIKIDMPLMFKYNIQTKQRDTVYPEYENLHQLSPLPLAISTNTNPKAHLSVAVYEFVEKGYKHIELQQEHRAKHDYANPKVIRELTLMQRDYDGIRFSGHASYVKTDLASTDEYNRKLSIETIKAEMALFEAFGVSILTVHTGRGTYSQNFDLLCRSVEELIPYAQALNMTLCVETAGREGFLLLTSEQYLNLCNRTGCKLTLDLPHIMTTDSDNFQENVDKLIPFAGNVHISDTFVPYHQHNPIGFGDFVTEELIAYLLERGYQGQVVIDAAEKGYSPAVYQDQGVAFAQSLPNYLTLG